MGALPRLHQAVLQASRIPGLQFLDQATRYRFYHRVEEAAAADRFRASNKALSYLVLDEWFNRFTYPCLDIS